MIREEIENGANFNISFEDRTLKINGAIVSVPEVEIDTDFIEKLNDLFEIWWNSTPSKLSDSKKSKKGYFNYRESKDMTDCELINGGNREVARFDLEFYVLQQIKSGLTWNDEWGKWFYQSGKNKELVMFKKWFIGD